MVAKSAGALESALRAQGLAQLGGSRPDQRADLEDLKKQFEESLDLLRTSKLGRGAVHSIPWFVLIGPPGSGKSTLLRQSGLSFPGHDQGAQCDPRSGVRRTATGGSPIEASCSTRRAVGRPRPRRNREEWLGFLRMIKKGRKQRPMNGVIVAIGLSELLESSEAEAQAYTESIRDRIDELTRNCRWCSRST